jgi:serine/threonine-protein kinase
LDQTQSEHASYDSARKILEKKIQERPEDSRFHSSLGIAYAGLGRKEDAIREGKLGTELLPISKEAYRGTYLVENLARIYVMAGESDAAIEQLDLLLSIPSHISLRLLQIDPAWTPLHDQPGFKELVGRYTRQP